MNTKKGYITLEAAIFLPLFIIALLSIGYFIKIIGINENIAHISIDETNYLASNSYLKKVAPLFPGRLKQRLLSENTMLTEVDISGYRYLYPDMKEDNIISLRIETMTPLKLPLGLFDQQYHSTIDLKCRGFVGKVNQSTPFTFDEMEHEGNSTIVFVFPMSGVRYHDQSCRVIKAHAIQQVMNRDIKNQYTSCRLCKSEEIPFGTFVYCFPDSGKAYHKGNCKTIDKYIVEIEKDDAVKKGYTPCNICNGGESYGTSK